MTAKTISALTVIRPVVATVKATTLVDPGMPAFIAVIPPQYHLLAQLQPPQYQLAVVMASRIQQNSAIMAQIIAIPLQMLVGFIVLGQFVEITLLMGQMLPTAESTRSATTVPMVASQIVAHPNVLVPHNMPSNVLVQQQIRTPMTG